MNTRVAPACSDWCADYLLYLVHHGPVAALSCGMHLPATQRWVRERTGREPVIATQATAGAR
jgi:hypothetical protein